MMLGNRKGMLAEACRKEGALGAESARAAERASAVMAEDMRRVRKRFAGSM